MVRSRVTGAGGCVCDPSRAGAGSRGALLPAVWDSERAVGARTPCPRDSEGHLLPGASAPRFSVAGTTVSTKSRGANVVALSGRQTPVWTVKQTPNLPGEPGRREEQT